MKITITYDFNEDDIRKWIIKNPDKWRKLLLTDQSCHLIKHIAEREDVTAAQITGVFDISIQNASSRLRGLHEKGYLVRDERAAASGGKEFVYNCNLIQ